MSSRIESLDTAKGILIVLVVLGHVLLFTGAYPQLLKIIYSFHMFSFLCISGIQWNNDKYNHCSFSYFFKRRVKPIIVCYCLFELIAVIIKTVFVWGTPDSIDKIIINICTGNGYVGADWYLYTYVFSVIIIFFLLKRNKIVSLFGLAVIELLVLYYLQINYSDFLMKISRILIFTITISFANLLKPQLLQRRKIPFLICIAILFCASSIYNDNVFLSASLIGNPILFFLSGLSGFILVHQLSMRLKSYYITDCGKKSLYIMGIHQNIEYLISYFYGISQNSAFLLLSFITMFTGSYLLAFPLKRFVDAIYH